MIRFPRTTRSAFTLVELLVAMSLIVILASLAVIIVPDVVNQDRTTDAAGSVRQWLTIAKMRAARDQQPRGVRFLFGIDPNNPAKTNANWITELQYTESPPILPLTSSKAAFGNVFLTFLCSYDNSGNPIYNGSSPQCIIQNLTLADAYQIVPQSLLTISNLNSSYRVTAVPNAPTHMTSPPAPSGAYQVQVVIDSFPQAQLGSAGQVGQNLLPVYSTTLFGITAPPTPLLGEPTLQLPKNVCVDLISSQLPLGQDFDIVFMPSGQVVPNTAAAASNQLFLWVRDYTKNGGGGGATAIPFNTNPVPQPALINCQQGGEQQIVALKTKSGAIGTFPIQWPLVTTGSYPAGQNAYTFALTGSTSP